MDRRRTVLTALIELATAVLMTYVTAPETFRNARPWAWRTILRASATAGRVYGRGGMLHELQGAELDAQRSYRVARRLTELSISAELRYRRSVGT